MQAHHWSSTVANWPGGRSGVFGRVWWNTPVTLPVIKIPDGVIVLLVILLAPTAIMCFLAVVSAGVFLAGLIFTGFDVEAARQFVALVFSDEVGGDAGRRPR